MFGLRDVFLAPHRTRRVPGIAYRPHNLWEPHKSILLSVVIGVDVEHLLIGEEDDAVGQGQLQIVQKTIALPDPQKLVPFIDKRLLQKP